MLPHCSNRPVQILEDCGLLFVFVLLFIFVLLFVFVDCSFNSNGAGLPFSDRWSIRYRTACNSLSIELLSCWFEHCVCLICLNQEHLRAASTLDALCVKWWLRMRGML